MTTKLELALKRTTSREECEIILNICDDLYNGIPVENYSVEDLPSKDTYERFANHSNHENIYHRKRFTELGTLTKFQSSHATTQVEDCVIFPNYDGIHVIVELTRKGKNFYPTSAHTKTLDVSEKISKFIKKISIVESTEASLKDATKLVIEGIFLCKCRTIFDDGKSALDHYNIAMNKLHMTLEDFKIDLDRFDFMGIDVVYIINGDEVREIDQINSFRLFTKLNIDFGKQSTHLLFNGAHLISKNSKKVNFYKRYIDILENESRPTNGIVYCVKAANHNDEKFIWLPPLNRQIRIDNITYVVEKFGLRFKITGANINVNSESDGVDIQISASDIERLSEEGLGIDAVCAYGTTQNNIRFISDVLIPSQKAYSPPRFCPKCREQLEYNYSDDGCLKSIRCVNPFCIIHLPERWHKFISNMFKICKSNGTELIVLDANRKKVKKMLPLNKMLEFLENKPLTVETIKTIAPTVFDEFDRLTLVNQLIALGIVNSKSQAEKLIIEKNYDTLADVPEVWIYRNSECR